MAVIVEMRDAAGLVQREAAKRLYRSNSFIWRMEVGERRVKVVELIEVSWVFGFRPESAIDRIVSKRALVPHIERHIEIPLSQDLRRFLQGALIGEMVRAREAAGKSQREVSREIGRSDPFVWKLEKELRNLEVVEYLELARAESFNPAETVARVARATVAKAKE